MSYKVTVSDDRYGCWKSFTKVRVARMWTWCYSDRARHTSRLTMLGSTARSKSERRQVFSSDFTHDYEAQAAEFKEDDPEWLGSMERNTFSQNHRYCLGIPNC